MNDYLLLRSMNRILEEGRLDESKRWNTYKSQIGSVREVGCGNDDLSYCAYRESAYRDIYCITHSNDNSVG